MKRIVLALLLIAGPVRAQIEPVPSVDDARIAIAAYVPGQQIMLHAPPGNPVSVLFMAGEHVQSVRLGDTSAFNVSVWPAADGLLVQSLQVPANTLMDVRTDQRNYLFSLSAMQSGPTISVVRIGNPAPMRQPSISMVPSPLPAEERTATWKLSGSKEILPASIRDDGAHVYIQWGATQAIPAVFAIERRGSEEMVNGYMRNGAFTIDRVYDDLVFRIDKISATARRIKVKPKRRK